ncbi:MAG: Gfo/Idh/MocA family oxidoreductase [Opitutaceae bacterium]|nr:Gfo/Idh/MocA family oxidoreductase [Opitutaceae bacterium]
MSPDPASPLRVGVIGCGQFMRQQHIQTVARSGQLVLQHLADRNEQALTDVADRYHPVRRSTNWEEVVADPAVDVVVVGIVPEFHPAVARAALAHGKPVYVEKPLAPTVAECRAVEQLARRLNLPVAVGFNRRFAPATRAMAAAFRQAKAPVSLYYRLADDERIRPPEQHWKTVDRLLTETVHIFDLLCHLLAAEPVEIYARESRPNDALITVDYANGSRATILSTSHASLAQPKEHLEAALGEGRFVTMDDYVEVRTGGCANLPGVQTFAGRAYDGCDNRHVDAFARHGLSALLEQRHAYEKAMRESGVLADSGNPAAWAEARRLLGEPPPPQINYAPDKGWGAALEEFCAAIAARRTPGNATARDGNRATACALAARQSIQSRQPMMLDPASWQT